MKLLHIDSSISGEGSATRQISSAIVKALTHQDPGIRVMARDLDRDPVPHLNNKSLASVRPAPEAPAGAVESDDNAGILQQFLDADIVVIGAPMYNFNVSSQLKAWLDRILIAGKETLPVHRKPARSASPAAKKSSLLPPAAASTRRANRRRPTTFRRPTCGPCSDSSASMTSKSSGPRVWPMVLTTARRRCARRWSR